MTNPKVLVVGNVIDGLTFIGPFPDTDTLVAYERSHDTGHHVYTVARLQAPDDGKPDGAYSIRVHIDTTQTIPNARAMLQESFRDVGVGGEFELSEPFLGTGIDIEFHRRKSEDIELIEKVMADDEELKTQAMGAAHQLWKELNDCRKMNEIIHKICIELMGDDYVVMGSLS